MLVAGKSKVAWAEGEGYLVGHLSEVSKFGKPRGHLVLPAYHGARNPRSLYVFESTAMGPKSLERYVGHGATCSIRFTLHLPRVVVNDLHKIKMSDPKWKVFGTEPPPRGKRSDLAGAGEIQLRCHDGISSVVPVPTDAAHADERGCWIRTNMDRKQAFVQSRSFVLPEPSDRTTPATHRRLPTTRLRISQEREGKDIDPCVENGGFGYKVYQFYLEDEYHLSKMESVNVAIPSDQIKLRVWEKPHPEGFYVIGVDPAGGRSEASNNHCASVWSCFADKTGSSRGMGR